MKTKQFRINPARVFGFHVIEMRNELGWEEISKPMPLAEAQSALEQLNNRNKPEAVNHPDCVKIGAQINVYRIQNQWMAANTAMERFGASYEYLSSLPEYKSYNEPAQILVEDDVPQQGELSGIVSPS